MKMVSRSVLLRERRFSNSFGQIMASSLLRRLNLATLGTPIVSLSAYMAVTCGTVFTPSFPSVTIYSKTYAESIDGKALWQFFVLFYAFVLIHFHLFFYFYGLSWLSVNSQVDQANSRSVPYICCISQFLLGKPYVTRFTDSLNIILIISANSAFPTVPSFLYVYNISCFAIRQKRVGIFSYTCTHEVHQI